MGFSATMFPARPDPRRWAVGVIPAVALALAVAVAALPAEARATTFGPISLGAQTLKAQSVTDARMVSKASLERNGRIVTDFVFETVEVIAGEAPARRGATRFTVTARGGRVGSRELRVSGLNLDALVPGDRFVLFLIDVGGEWRIVNLNRGLFRIYGGADPAVTATKLWTLPEARAEIDAPESTGPRAATTDKVAQLKPLSGTAQTGGAALTVTPSATQTAATTIATRRIETLSALPLADLKDHIRAIRAAGGAEGKGSKR